MFTHGEIIQIQSQIALLKNRWTGRWSGVFGAESGKRPTRATDLPLGSVWLVLAR